MCRADGDPGDIGDEVSHHEVSELLIAVNTGCAQSDAVGAFGKRMTSTEHWA